MLSAYDILYLVTPSIESAMSLLKVSDNRHEYVAALYRLHQFLSECSGSYDVGLEAVDAPSVRATLENLARVHGIKWGKTPPRHTWPCLLNAAIWLICTYLREEYGAEAPPEA